MKLSSKDVSEYNEADIRRVCLIAEGTMEMLEDFATDIGKITVLYRHDADRLVTEILGAMYRCQDKEKELVKQVREVQDV